MPENFGEERNLQLSTVTYLRDQINTSWSNITTTVGSSELPKGTPPIVTIRVLTKSPTFVEIGTTTMTRAYNIAIEIFGTSEPNRMDLASFLEPKIKVGWLYYEYADKDTRTANGRVRFRRFLQHARIESPQDVPAIERFRHIFSVEVVIEPNA